MMRSPLRLWNGHAQRSCDVRSFPERTSPLRPGVIAVCDIRQRRALRKSKNGRYLTAIGDTVEPEPP
jgi:hypothetical protein